jgi:hypothetical protein
MDAKRALEIADRALRMLVDYPARSGGKGVHRLLEWTAGGSELNCFIGAALGDFANHAILVEHTADWGTAGYIPKRDAEAKALLLTYPLTHKAGGAVLQSLAGFLSWLYLVKPGHYGIAFDEGQIERQLEKCSGLDKARVHARLFFHELGHIVLHRSELLREDGHYFLPASPKMEEEAWFFAGVVMTYAAANGTFRDLASEKNVDFGWMRW